MTNSPYQKSRSRLVKWLRQQVIGPPNKDEGILRISPLEKYPTGVLYPVEPGYRGVDPASGNQEEFDPALLEEDEDEGEKEDSAEGREFGSSVRQRRYVPPSSVGFSFFVRGRVELSLTASAATYRSNGVEGRDERGQFKSVEYAREALAERTTHWSDAGNKPEAGFSLWEGRAALDINRRPHRDGCIITVSLCNRRELDSNTPQRVRSADRVGKSLFEVELSCVVECGEVKEYPRVDPSLLSNEEQELELQYRKQRIYAVGHGAAANWEVLPSDKPRIWCEFMPEVEVPLMTVNTGGDDSDVYGRDLGVEIDPAMVADKHSCYNLDGWLRNLFKHWREQARSYGEANADVLRKIQAHLRPDVDLPTDETGSPLNHRVEEIGRHIEQLTDDQMRMVDVAAANPRVLCAGGAGTGKTFLAERLARHWAETGMQVALVCRSAWLRHFLDSRLAIPGLAVSSIEGVGLERRRLGLRKFDALIVDEGQDLLENNYMETLDSTLPSLRWL